MNPAKRIIINTTAQYSRSIINTVLSLYSTRLIMGALGISDFGIYSIVGGLVAMLGFITNALVVTTQRYISFHYGEKNIDEVRKIFINSIFMHVIFSILMSAILLLLKDVVIYQWINIPDERLDAAGYVYVMTIAILAITIITAPYKAVFIAHENIVYISLIEVADAVIKLLLAIQIANSDTDRLIMYATAMTVIQMANFIAFTCYATNKFTECQFTIKKNYLDKKCIRRLIGFAGWTTYGTGSVVFRNQGIAIMLNHFFGTITNAAYGIAFQVYGAMAFVATSILNAMNPQIMKAEGASDRMRMIHLAMQESKYSSALMLIITIPIIQEIQPILEFWLKEVPENTGMFCTFILMAFIFDQLTYGLNTANQASGQIRTYTLLMYTPKLIILPLIWFALSEGHMPVSAMWIYLITEIIVSILRLPFMKYTINLNITVFIRKVIVPLIPLVIALYSVSTMCINYIITPFRFVITFILSVSAGLLVFYLFTINHEERTFVRNLFSKRNKR